jgi:hypothetical protein
MLKLKEVVHCWKIDVDNIDDDDPHGIQIKESEGGHTLKGKVVDMVTRDHNGLIKNKKHNIGNEEAPKMAIIGDYWDKEMVTQVFNLLKEYEDFFPQSFSDMKFILGSLGAINIQLEPDAKMVKRRPYLLNPKYKEKVCKETYRMLDARIIVPVEEFEWISPMVVQPKNIEEICTCFDLMILNAFLQSYGIIKNTHKRLTKRTQFRLVYGKEAVMPLEFFVPSLRVTLST